MLARINTDIALANFEASVRNLVSDVEIAYWELYFDYRSLGTARQGATAPWHVAKDLQPLQPAPDAAARPPEASPAISITSSAAPAEQALNACTSPRRNCAT